jgi:hypothetical protein
MNQNNDQELTHNNDQVEEQGNEQDIINEKVEFLHYITSLQSQIRYGADWFLWIAGLSVFNSLSYLLGYNWNFVCGLGVTQIIDGIIYEMQGTGKVIGLFIDFIFIGGFVLLGYLARKRYNWIFIFGIIIYVLDAAIFLLWQDWLSIGFHVYAIYGIYKGWSANRELTKIESELENDY